MTRSYPYELRTRVIEALSKMTITQVAQIFQLSRWTIYKWKAIKDKTGEIQARIGYQRGHSHKISNIEAVKEFIDQNSSKSLKELARIYPGNLSTTTIWRGLQKLGYTYKNLFSSQERQSGKRRI